MKEVTVEQLHNLPPDSYELIDIRDDGLAIAKTYTEAVGGHFHVEVSGDQFRAVVTVPRLTRTD